MPGVPLLKSEVVKKLLDGIYFACGHKKTGNRKVNKPWAIRNRYKNDYLNFYFTTCYLLLVNRL